MLTKAEYLAKRKILIEAAESALKEGKYADFEDKEKEVKDLDEQYEKQARNQANLNALKGSAVAMDVGLVSVANVVDKLTPQAPKDEKKEYAQAWAKEMMGIQLNDSERAVFDKVNTEFRAATQTAATHHVVIPETVAAGIWKEAGNLFPVVGDLPMTFVKGDLTILQETDSGDDAAWYAEGDEVVDGDFAIGELTLTGCELAKSIPVSWKLRKMAIEEFIPYITSLLAEKVGSALAKGALYGRGKPGVGDSFKAQPKGVVTVIEAEVGTPQVVTYSTATGNGLSYDKVAQAVGKIKSQYVRGAKIYAKNETIWGQLALIKDKQDRPMFVPDVTAGGVGRIFGLVVEVDDSVAADAILIGNVRKGYAVNVNEQMTIYTQENVKKRYTDYMAYALVDGDVKTAKAFAYIKRVSAQ